MALLEPHQTIKGENDNKSHRSKPKKPRKLAKTIDATKNKTKATKKALQDCQNWRGKITIKSVRGLCTRLGTQCGDQA